MNIVVTGASRGIGYQIVKKLLERGEHSVFAVARSGNELESLQQYGKGDAYNFLAFNLMQENYNELISGITNAFPHVDVLINNAGLLINKPLADLSDSDFDNIFQANVKSVFKLVRDLLPHFSDQAHIVNISSMGGYQGSAKFQGLSLYSASKGALGVFTECLAEELKEQKICANALALGAVQTEMLSEVFPGYKAPVSADEMADFIIDFSMKAHHFINGKIIPVSLSTP
ncbi:MAG: short-chain dehydrogenase [Bacteroidetes bacterium]|nr:MAG: short-chain dehydrogenase [Bacteroidota bacterium]